MSISKLKESFFVSSLILIFLISLFSVSAIDKLTLITGGNLTNQGNFSTINETAVGSDTAQGGNVTYMNLTTTASTVKWQGYYGQVSANLLIGASSSGSTSGGLHLLYSWGAAQINQIKYVFATASSDYPWQLLTVATAANVVSLDTALGWSSSDVDSANATFDDGLLSFGADSALTANLTSYQSPPGSTFFAGEKVSNVYKTSIFNNGSTVSLEMFTFGARITPSGEKGGGNGFAGNRAFDNSTIVDYEMIVPTNGTNIADGTRGVNTYYFWLEVN